MLRHLCCVLVLVTTSAGADASCVDPSTLVQSTVNLTRLYDKEEKSAGHGSGGDSWHRLVSFSPIDRHGRARDRGHASFGSGLERNRDQGAKQQRIDPCAHRARPWLAIRTDCRARVEGGISRRDYPCKKSGAARTGRTSCQSGLSQRRVAFCGRSLRTIRRQRSAHGVGTSRNARRQGPPRAGSWRLRCARARLRWQGGSGRQHAA